VKIDKHEQGSTGWQQARLGIPTASTMSRLVTASYKVSDSEGAREFVWEKLAEKTLGYAPADVSTFGMSQGTLGEGEAVGWYELMTGQKVESVGFCVTDDGRCGASPDGLIGEDNGIEIKCPAPHTHLKYLAAGVVPTEYRLQVQTCMYVTGRTAWTFVSYSRFFPPMIVHAHRDPKAQEAITAALDLFWNRYAEAEAKLSEHIKNRASK